MQSPFPQSPPKGSSQTKGEHIKKDKGKKALSSEEAVKEAHPSNKRTKINQQKKIERAKLEAANKRLKSSVQYEDHLPGTVLNEPVLVPNPFKLSALQSLKIMKVSSLQCMQRISSKEITPQLSFNHLAILQASDVHNSLIDSKKGPT
ncbi:hypothetical protein Tco_0581606 [Tanacetum coccineum]